MQAIKIKKDTVDGILVKTNRSLSDLAREMEVSNSYLTKLLNGDRNPTPKFRAKLQEALNVDVEEWDTLFKMVRK
jgi:transcriptional regulator with XRE-family HTH domain